MTDHNRKVTPYTDPGRWTEEEKALFDQQKCCWQTEIGHSGSKYCKEPSAPAASFGYCAEHLEQLLAEHQPDGTPVGAI